MTDMIIRNACKDDMPELIAGSLRFHEAMLKQKTLTFDPDSAKKLMMFLIGSPAALVLVMEMKKSIVGAIGGFLSPWMLDWRIKIMTEFFWWLNEERRGSGIRLLIEFERLAKIKGADRMIMVTLQQDDETLARYYERRGYKHLEHHFIKEI